MLAALPADWKTVLQEEFDKSYFTDLTVKITQAYETQKIYPPLNQIFNALTLCPFNSVKVVIIGQDPYHAAGQAHGLSFSVNDGVRQPPSLRNIYKELLQDITGFTMPVTGNLEGWARQGVLLLNTILTVKESSPGSHKNMGWETFTDAIIKQVSDKLDHVVFLLWGNYAISKSNLVDGNKHLVLKAAHPSPLAGGKFFGSRHFSRANQFLESKGIAPINWQITDEWS